MLFKIIDKYWEDSSISKALGLQAYENLSWILRTQVTSQAQRSTGASPVLRKQTG